MSSDKNLYCVSFVLKLRTGSDVHYFNEDFYVAETHPSWAITKAERLYKEKVAKKYAGDENLKTEVSFSGSRLIQEGFSS